LAWRHIRHTLSGQEAEKATAAEESTEAFEEAASRMLEYRHRGDAFAR
jgi:hypothetical protein